MNHPHSHSHSPTLNQANSPPRQSPLVPSSTQLLILGAGWTWTFLHPLLKESGIHFVATTQNGRDGTVKFQFDKTSTDPAPYKSLPRAQTILITFPLKSKEEMKLLVDMYTKTHPSSNNPGSIYTGMERMNMAGGTGTGATLFNWILLGSTGIYVSEGWSDDSSDYDRSNARAQAEDYLIANHNGCVLNLSGLYGDTRQPWNWVSRIADTKEKLRSKGSVHLIHGQDVARAIISAHWKYKAAAGKRWIVTDLHVYDWWELVFDWGERLTRIWKNNAAISADTLAAARGEKPSPPEYRKWVVECMNEEGIRALPRSAEQLRRSLDGRAFWKAMGITPVQGRPTWA